MLSKALKAVKPLIKKGYKAYLVGGSVRDMLIERKECDIDIATNAHPTDIIKTLKEKNFTVIPTGLKHGTVTAIKGKDRFEISTFRGVVSVTGKREVIEFADTIEEDLGKRDFTMNAIAYDLLKGEFIDPFDGMDDLSLGIIKAVGNKSERFFEDPLRILRAFRFQSELNFRVEKNTLKAIKKVSEKIDFYSSVSKERIRDEFVKCFEKALLPSVMFLSMLEAGVLKKIMPSLNDTVDFEQNRYHIYDLFVHTLKTIDCVPRSAPLIRFAALFHDLGKVETCENYNTPDATFYNHERVSAKMAKKIMKELRFSNKDILFVTSLVENHMFLYSKEISDRGIRRFISRLGVDNLEDFFILKNADSIAGGIKTVKEIKSRRRVIEARFRDIVKRDKAFSVKDLKVKGSDLIEELNLKEGPQVGQILKKLLKEVLDEPHLNTKRKLLIKAKELMS